MNRIYHGRIVWYHYLYFILLLTMMIAFLWERLFIPGAIFMLWSVYMTEKVLHTVYTVTPEYSLIISQGRFSRKIIIRIEDIDFIDPMYLLKISGIAVTKFILIKHKNKYYSLLPKKEKEVELLELLTNYNK